MANYQLGPEFQNWDSKENWESIQNWQPPEDLRIIYRTVPGPEENQEIEIKIYLPKRRRPPCP